MSERRAVVAGGAGFIGSHLCEALLARGDEVVCVDNLITGSAENLQGFEDHPRFSFLRHDLSKPVALDGPVDLIFNMASPASPRDYLEFPIQTLKVGALGTHNLLGLARAKEARFLLASTSEVYGDPAVHPQPETYWGHVNTVGPRGVYDEAKRYAEALTMAYHRVHGLKTRIARIFNTYGPGMRRDDGRAIPNFINQALRGEPLTLYGDGTQTRSFCFIDDLVRGLLLLMEKGHGLPVNLGGPEEITLRDLAERVRRLVGTNVPIVEKPLPEDDPKQRRPDITRARELLGWEPATPLEAGLERTVASFRAAMAEVAPRRAA